MTVTVNGTTGVSLVQDATITQPKMAPNVASGGPCFSAWQSAGQTLGSNVYNKMALQTEEFDIGNCFDSATFRFQPNVAGYYSFTLSLYVPGASRSAEIQLLLYKNGVACKAGFGSYANVSIASMVALIYLNGTTDYVEPYVYTATGGPTLPSQSLTYFQAYLARSA